MSQESGVRSQKPERSSLPQTEFARSKARTFEDLTVWQRAHQFVLSVCTLTDSFPAKEIYSLAAQFHRAAISIPANIAEGFRKLGRADKCRFLNIAQGSLEECRYYLILARDPQYGNPKPAWSLLEETSKLLTAYLKAITANAALPHSDS